MFRASSLVLALTLFGTVAGPSGAPAQDSGADKPDRTQPVRKLIDQHIEEWLGFYKTLHQDPELSYQEEKTAARLAGRMRELGYDVTEKVGGHGIVCVLKNGDGPTVLVRTDMDALPIVERTGLAYASKVRIRDAEGKEVGVMHACGHDMHMTCWLGTAAVLAALKDQWHGTLVFIGQPAEERGGGAKAMLEAGLFTRFPKPDYALALHCDGAIPHGQVGFTEGQALANVDSVDITVKGKGGHGSAPHTTIDPVVIAARIVLDLQTIVSREIDPTDAAVITVGSIHGGSKHNIIPAEVKMQLTVRSFSDATRKHLLDGIARVAKAAAAAARAPEPEIKVDPSEFTPSMTNDVALTRKTVTALRRALGDTNVQPKPPVMGGEDFSRYSRDGGVPIFMFRLGTVPPEKVAEAARGGRPLPSLHSDLYYPVPEPSIRTGVLGMSAAVLNLVGK
jgi:hippurate hydrolase